LIIPFRYSAIFCTAQGWAAFILLLCLGPCLGLAAPRADAAPLQLLVLGDSLTAGYGLPASQGFQAQLTDALHAAGENVALIDGAVSGDTSADAAARLDWVLAGGPVDAAIVELGGNDGLRGLDPATTGKNIGYILRVLHSRHIPILLSGMRPPPSFGADYDRQFADMFAALGRYPGVIYDPFFLAGLEGHPDDIQADGIHPNAAGVAIEVKRLLPLVQRLLAQARHPAG
jgi:acyl-CoA thioesterase-1